MKYGKLISLLMTAVLALAAVVISTMEPQPQPEAKVNTPVSVEIELDGRRERIACWEEAPGDYVVFLPSGADLEDVTLLARADEQVILDDVPLPEEMSCGGFRLDTAYEILHTADGLTQEGTLTFAQSAQVPALYLDTLSGSMDQIHATKGYGESGSLRVFTAQGQLDYAGQVDNLKGRGNSSWYKAKKPYSLTLAREGDLLGMGQAKEWVLLANAMDPSHLRNKAASDLATRAGMPYVPDSQWVDLYLNGEYVGLYLLSERIEIHPHRVNLSESGSFLVSREVWWRLTVRNRARFQLDSGAAMRIRDSGLTESSLYRIWQPAENAILAEDGVDPETGKSWQELIDLDSWAMDYLTGEIFGNVDCGSISEYFYLDGQDPSGKIYAGPVWDYDLAMGSTATWQTQTVQAFFGDKLHLWSLEDTTWFYWLNRKPEFQDRVRTLYKEVYRPLVVELLKTGLDDYARQIHQGALMNQRRWKRVDPLEETEYIRRYLTERLAFLDSVWLEDTLYYKALVILDENSSSICHAVLPGQQIPELPYYEEHWRILGWYDAETEEPFDITQPIEKDTVVYLKRIDTEDVISTLQVVPIAVVLAILGTVVLLDRKFFRTQTPKKDSTIAKQEIV